MSFNTFSVTKHYVYVDVQKQLSHVMRKPVYDICEPEDHWSCIAHLIAEDMLKSAVIEEKTFKHSPWAGADNPLGPKF